MNATPPTTLPAITPPGVLWAALSSVTLITLLLLLLCGAFVLLGEDKEAKPVSVSRITVVSSVPDAFHVIVMPCDELGNEEAEPEDEGVGWGISGGAKALPVVLVKTEVLETILVDVLRVTVT